MDKDGGIRAKWLSGQKWLYLVKDFVFGQMVIVGQSGCIQGKWLYSANGSNWAKVVLFGQSCCIRAKWLHKGKSGRTRAKLLF